HAGDKVKRRTEREYTSSEASSGQVLMSRGVMDVHPRSRRHDISRRKSCWHCGSESTAFKTPQRACAGKPPV
ncbi:hypothetical protein BASA62_005079, partial [Batrachochytrium salamandrivorans]